MKILYHHRIASKDGQFVHVDEICHALRELGHEVKVIGPKSVDDGRMGKESRVARLLKTYVPNYLYELLEISYSIFAYRRLNSWVRSFQPDLVYERYSLYMLAGVWVKRKTKVKFALEVNSPLAEERDRYGSLRFKRLARKIERSVWRSADYVFPVSKVLANLIRNEGVKSSRIHVIHNGANLCRVRQAPNMNQAKRKLNLEGKIVLGFVGFVRKWHSLERVIRVLQKDEFRNQLHLLIVGAGPALATLETLVANCHLEDMVTFAGAVERNRVLEYIAAFDVALQPDVVSYASPLKLFDYLAMGKAVVAPDTPNIREILTHEKDALLFDISLSDDFDNMVERLVNNHELRRKLGTSAKKTIIDKKLDWLSNARQICQVTR